MIPVHKGDNLRDLAEHHGKIHQWTPDEVSGVAAFMLRTLEDQGLGELVSAGAAESDGPLIRLLSSATAAFTREHIELMMK